VVRELIGTIVQFPIAEPKLAKCKRDSFWPFIYPLLEQLMRTNLRKIRGSVV
jgi:hypothetical protein